MSEMIERVAMAIHEQSLVTVGWKFLSNAERNSYVLCATAVIEAMRKPTAAMESKCLTLLWSKADISDERPVELWQAMIDAALVP